MPTEYEIATSKLHYYTRHGFEVRTPLKDWYDKHQKSSPLYCSVKDWESFRDPRGTTHAEYVQTRHEGEVFLDGLFKAMLERPEGRHPSDKRRALMLDAFLPAIYAFHGFQMVAAYIGQMAPSGRISITALLQGADEMRRIQWFARRAAQQEGKSEDADAFAARIKESWQTKDFWQPLRKTLELLLTTYDWGESLAALNLCLKPLLDFLLLNSLGPLLREEGDLLFPEALAALEDDCRWQREWTAALFNVAFTSNPENVQVARRWVDLWSAASMEAVQTLGSFFLGKRGSSLPEELASFHKNYLQKAGIERP